MTWVDVDDMTTSNMSSNIVAAHETLRDLNGDSLSLVNVTKDTSEWGGLDGWESVKYNASALLQSAINTLKANYSGKEIDTDGIYITYEEV